MSSSTFPLLNGTDRLDQNNDLARGNSRREASEPSDHAFSSDAGAAPPLFNDGIDNSFLEGYVPWDPESSGIANNSTTEQTDVSFDTNLQNFEMQDGSDGGLDWGSNIAQGGREYDISPLGTEPGDFPFYPQQAENLIYAEDGQTGAQMGRMFQGYSTLGFEEEMALREIAMPSSTATTTPSTEMSSNNKQSTITTPSTRKSSNDRQSFPPTMSFRRTTHPSGQVSKRRRMDTASSFSSSSYGYERDSGNEEPKDEDDEEEEEEEVQHVEAFKALKKKQGHNAIEKRYRSSLNDKILTLDKCIPLPASIEQSTSGNFEGESNQQHKTTKSAILTRAVKHIKSLEKSRRRLISESDALNVRVAAFEKLAMTGTLRPRP